MIFDAKLVVYGKDKAYLSGYSDRPSDCCRYYFG
jgi:hypothetical protein